MTPRAKACLYYFHNNPSCFTVDIIINFSQVTREYLKYNPRGCRRYVCYSPLLCVDYHSEQTIKNESDQPHGEKRFG